MERHWKIRLLALLIAWGGASGLWAQDSLPTPPQDSLAARDSLGTVPDPVVDTTVPESDSAVAAVEAAYVDDGLVTFNLSTPYHTVLTHLYFLQEESYHPDSAALALYVRDPGSKESIRTAIQLKEYLDGSGYFIDLDIIPKDPNYLDSASGLHKYLLVPDVPDIFLYKRGDRWLYSGTTARSIADLHAAIYPFGTLEWLPDWSRTKVLGLELWQYLGLVLFLLVAIVIHRLLTLAIRLVLERVLKRLVRSDATQEFFSKIARPISLLILFYILMFLTPVLQLPINLNKWIFLAYRIMIPVFYMLIALQVVNVAMAFFSRRAEKTESTLDDQLIPLLRNLFKGIVVILFIIFVLDMLRINITALIGGVAFGSLALALAAQDTVKNLFGSLLIFVDRPFQIGDWVIIDGHEGVVEEVSVRSTRIRTFANSLISIPNGNIASTAINNMGARIFRRFVTRIGVTYDTPPHLIETYVRGIREIVRTHPHTRKDAFEVHFNEMGDFNLQILVYIFFEVPTWTQELEARQEFLLAVMRLAQRLGVQFAFPTQTLQIETFPEKRGNSPTYPHSEGNYERAMEEFLIGYEERVNRQKKTRDERKLRGSDVSSDAGQSGVGGA
ncbi:MAG: mechanosensitive ion channel family protein [Bacteroidota bacterium]